jgi:DNA topoisomerase-2
LDNKARFVVEVCSGELVVSNRKRSELLAELFERGYELSSKDEDETSEFESNEEDEEADMLDEDTQDAELAKGYEYLLGMKSEYHFP